VAALAAPRLRLGAAAFLPVHWGTFSLAMHTWDEPAELLLAAHEAGRLAPGTRARAQALLAAGLKRRRDVHDAVTEPAQAVVPCVAPPLAARHGCATSGRAA
jgi:DNA-binding IclR family transcriptional regulator